MIYRQLPIKHKLISIIMLTSLITLLLGYTAFVLNERQTTSKTMEYILASQAELIGTNSIAAITFGDAAAARETLATLSSQKHIQRAIIFLQGGEIFASHQSQNASGQIQNVPYKLEGYFENGSHLEVYKTIYFDDAPIAVIYLGADISTLRQNIAGYSGILITGLILALILALILSTRLQKTITHPILTIKNITNKISKGGDYTLRIQKNSDDELGDVIDSINHMLSEIQIRDLQLENHAETLEKKVTSRTKELESLTEQLRHQAYHDALTGLPNRSLFYERLEHAIAQASRSEQKHAILYIDLDGFKNINDTLGHEIGDKFLKQLTLRLQQVTRQSDTLCRLGGDEFTLIINNVSDREVINNIARQILENIMQPVECSQHQVSVTASIGVSRYPEDSESPSQLIMRADTAMYAAKNNGKNQIVFYSEL